MLVISLILVSGLSSVTLLPRMEDPALTPRAAFVNTLFPGADPERVESLVSEKIEDALSEIDGIKELRSVSREGISTINIELRDEIVDTSKIWSKIRDEVNDVEGELPPEASKPEVDNMDFKAYAMLYALRWNQDGPVNYAILNRWAKQLEDELKGIPGTEKVEVSGAPDEEILVAIDHDRLNALRLSVSDISRRIEASDSKVSAGQVRGDDEMLIEVAGEFDSIQRIEEIPIRYTPDGGFIQLGDLATISKTIANPPNSLAIVEGQRAVVLGVFVRPSKRIDLWAQDVDRFIDQFEQRLPTGILLDRMFNQNEYVAARLSTLLGNLMVGGIAVFVVILIMMGWRSAITVSIALPLAAMMVLFGMRLLEIPIHQMSVTGLIIALGLLIDNAIVIVDESNSHLKQGSSAAEAVSKSVRHLFFPLFGSTLTTAFAFAPIALMPGPAGEFVGAIALTVIMAIFSSFFLAMTVIPAISVRMNPNRTDNNRDSWLLNGISVGWLLSAYRGLLNVIIRVPVIGIAIGVALPAFGFWAATQLNEQFFPPADRDQLHIELELSPTSSVDATLATTERVRELLLQDPEIERVDWFIGESAPAFYYNLVGRRRNISQYAQALVQLKEFKSQSTLIHKLQDVLDREFAHARILVRQLEQGPPFDAPVEVRLFGPDLDRLQEIGQDVRRILVNTPGVIHTRSEMDEVLPKVAFEIKEEKARAAGITLTEVALQLSASTDGAIGGSILEATEELPVRVRLEDANRSGLTSVVDLDIVKQDDGMSSEMYRGIPLSAIADVSLKSGFGSITHMAGRRMNEIQCYIPAGVLPSTVLSRFRDRLEESGLEMPAGYSLTFGGEAAKRDEAISNLMASVGILLVMMIATLVLSFSSFRVAGIVGFVGALSVGLGMGGLWYFGYPFGFTAIIGTMGLMGVAINDTIVVLAAIKNDEAASAGDPEAMREVIVHSTRHIISTSLTTMAGFAPLIIGGGGFWPPLAVAIAGGVGGATILALFLAPSAYLMTMCRKSRIATS